MTVSTRTVTVADTRFLVREHGGDGRPVLLLHGVPETSSCWDDLAPRVAATGRRVLAPDLPGLGGSAYTGPYDAPSLLRQLAALVEAETDGAVDVVGHDWGGVLALALAGERPELVRRLAVANTAWRQVPARALHVPAFATPVLPELVFRVAGRQVVDLMLRLGWKADRPLDPDRRAEYEAAYSDPEKVSAMLGYYRAAARPRLRALLPGQPEPAGQPRVAAERTLVVWGAGDPVLPVSLAEGIAKDLGPDTVVVTVPGAGHFVVEEAPDVVAEAVLDLLADPAGEGAPTPAPKARTTAATREAAPRKATPRKATPRKAAAPGTSAPRKSAPRKGPAA